MMNRADCITRNAVMNTGRKFAEISARHTLIRFHPELQAVYA